MKRYVDDILCNWDRSIDLLHVFLDYINNIYININFTLEVEKNNKSNFLDVTLEKNLTNNKITFGIFRKNTTTDIIIPSDSFHFTFQKTISFENLTYTKIPLNILEFDKEKNTSYTKKHQYKNNSQNKLQTINKNNNNIIYKSLIRINNLKFKNTLFNLLRIKKHLRDTTTSEFGKHISLNGHRLDENKLLHRDKKDKLKILEAYKIDKKKKNSNKNCLNKQTDLNFKPLYKKLENPLIFGYKKSLFYNFIPISSI